MKALSILGTSSNAGKSWLATALCALLRRRGVRVAPFKAQNMSNNSFVTLDGGEIGRAQAAQAEACGLAPCVEMNPILLKPSGALGSQLVVLGEAREHLKAAEYYQRVEQLWPVVCEALAFWRSRCDVLVLEGAGSPVELNLMARDLVNLRPVHHLDGRWLLVADIERGGVFAQLAGTWQLLSERDRAAGLGVVVNKFRGDLALFADAGARLAPHVGVPYLGALPHRGELQPESEDSLCREAEERDGEETLAWVRFPHLSNSQDAQPWLHDEGVDLRWVSRAPELRGAKAIVLPGSKNTLADLAWLRRAGLDREIAAAAGRGVPVIGICGGYQMLGRRLSDAEGTAGDAGDVPGLDLLPVVTSFSKSKEVRQVEAAWDTENWVAYGEGWPAYEIHMGRTQAVGACAELLRVRQGDGWRGEGARAGTVWGTYLHGLFESEEVRRAVAQAAGLHGYRASRTPWRVRLQRIYDGMADLLEEHLNLEPVWSYVAS